MTNTIATPYALPMPIVPAGSSGVRGQMHAPQAKAKKRRHKRTAVPSSARRQHRCGQTMQAVSLKARATAHLPPRPPAQQPLAPDPARLTLESQYDGQAAQHEDVVDLLDVHLALHMLVRVHDRQAREHPQHPAAAAAEVMRVVKGGAGG